VCPYKRIVMLPPFTSQSFSSAQEFLDACAPALEKTRAAIANMPIAPSYAAAKAGNNPTTPKQWWIAVSAPHEGGTALFTLTVLGTFPGGLASSVDPKILESEYLNAAMDTLAGAAKAADLPVSRMISTSGPRLLAEAFAEAWGAANGLKPKQEPLMRMNLAVLTKDTLQPPVRLKPDNVTLDMVGMGDLEAASQMLVNYSRDALPRRWTLESAKEMARAKIEEGAFFGARINGELKAFAMMTRPMPTVKAIAQVFTDADARGQGLADLVTREAVNRCVGSPPLPNGLTDSCRQDAR
jgi:hypothetical protein